MTYTVRSFILLALFTTTLVAGDRSNIRAMGMGRTFVAGSRNVDALGINPANLSLEDRLPITILPFEIGGRVSSEYLNYDMYQKYFTGMPDPTNPNGDRISRVLSPEDKNTLLSTFPDDGVFIRSDVELAIGGLSFQLGKIGSVGVMVLEHVGTRVDLRKDYLKMAMMGLDSLGSRYNFSGTNVSAWWYREYNLSYANRFPIDLPFVNDLCFGVGYKLIQGFGVAETEHYNSSFGNYIDPSTASSGFPMYTLRGNFDFLTRHAGSPGTFKNKSDSSGNKLEFDFKPFPEPAGKGSGIDLGLSSEITDGIRVAVSITDIGSITWEKGVRETSGEGSLTVVNPFTLAGTDSLKRAIQGQEKAGASFKTELPTTLRIGATFQSEKLPILSFLPGKMLLAIDYNQGLNESMGNTTKARFSAGMEYRIIPLIPLRTGISVGGNDRLRWALGFGLDFLVVSWDLSTENFGMLFSPKSFNMFSVSTGLRVRL